MITYRCFVEYLGEPSAGIRPFTEDLILTVAYDVGGEPGEFAESFKTFLQDWFDTPRVRVEELKQC